MDFKLTYPETKGKRILHKFSCSLVSSRNQMMDRSVPNQARDISLAQLSQCSKYLVQILLDLLCIHAHNFHR